MCNYFYIRCYCFYYKNERKLQSIQMALDKYNRDIQLINTDISFLKDGTFDCKFCDIIIITKKTVNFGGI